jgi:hypothetical protein|tara:strand:- start:58 stop:540 length:483 start_codon:yes stop_codon:yes gene_type:complete
MNTKEKLEMVWKYLALILVAGLGFKLLDSHHNSIASPFSFRNHDKNGVVFIGDYDGDFAKFGSAKKMDMDIKVEKEVVDGDTVVNVTVNGKPVDASKFDETNNEMRWISEDGEVHIIKKIHGGKNQGDFRNMEFIIEENEDDLHENGDKIMIRKKIKRKK